MTILITIGPTQEPLDAMRILSNRSTGDLGTRIALGMAAAGHRVIALRGTGCTAKSSELASKCARVIPFTSTEDLRSCLESLSQEETIDAIYHAAAVSDFYLPCEGTGKIPTSGGALTLTLEPTPKLLPLLRGWFPHARITGWKFEAAGDRDSSLVAGRSQIASCRTNACVVNGPSYGEGFGVLSKSGELIHLTDRTALCSLLTTSLSG
jgi:phosphopantothenoylcysteine decarboxylase/phosphopantothenate--cysteine ligase